MGICLAPRCYPCLCSSQWRHRMWRNHRDRPDDPRTVQRETERLARDEYDRPRYGSDQHTYGDRPRERMWDPDGQRHAHEAFSRPPERYTTDHARHDEQTLHLDHARVHEV